MNKYRLTVRRIRATLLTYVSTYVRIAPLYVLRLTLGIFVVLPLVLVALVALTVRRQFTNF